MPESPRQRALLYLSVALAVFTLATGIWLFWLSRANHLLFVGGALLTVSALTAYCWRRRSCDGE